MKTNNNFNILIVDDEKFNIELAAVYLKEEGYKLSFALNAKSALEAVYKKEISLILLDINMPKTDGFEVCTMLKKDIKTKDIPIIFLTAQTDIEYISRAFEAGGADYISKPFNGVELKARVRTQLQNLSYLEEIKHKQSKLAQLSITDPLTKLKNALYFDSQIKIYQSTKKDFWILYLKLDNFEKVNNLYGFYASNKIIKRLAAILKTHSSVDEVVSKLYGVSFGLLLKDYSKEDTLKLYKAIYSDILEDKELSKLINISAVLYHVTNKDLDIPSIYKHMQAKAREVEEKMEYFAFL